MEVVWNKFNPRQMPSCQWLYVTDYEKVWLRFNGSDWHEEMDKWLWSEAIIFYPDLPKKERHWCGHREFSSPDSLNPCSVWRCSQDQDSDGDLFLEVMIPNEKTTHKSAVIFIRNCPFCGWSKEKE